MTRSQVTVRPAGPADVPAIEAVDPVAATDEGRRRFIAERVAAGQTLVAVGHDDVRHDAGRQGAGGDDIGEGAVAGTVVLGYLVMDHAFFERGFVVMLCVHPERRRRGIGRALLRHAERACRTPRIFTSTNRSNLPMQRLLEGMGYRRSGEVDDLDPGDPEVFYSRWLGQRA
ncbi:MAG: GNAT family N-acetyltransferase [Trueperaceae bacterium]